MDIKLLTKEIAKKLEEAKKESDNYYLHGDAAMSAVKAGEVIAYKDILDMLTKKTKEEN